MRAFTLLELLVALSVFLFGMVTILQIFPANRRLLTQTGETTQAAFLAQEQLELLRSVSYATLTVGTYAAKAAITSTVNSPFAGYSRDIVVQLLDTNRNVTNVDVGLKKVTTTIYWTDHSVNRTYSLSTYVTQ